MAVGDARSPGDLEAHRADLAHRSEVSCPPSTGKPDLGEPRASLSYAFVEVISFVATACAFIVPALGPFWKVTKVTSPYAGEIRESRICFDCRGPPEAN